MYNAIIRRVDTVPEMMGGEVAIIQEVVNRLTSQLPVEQIYLFGSRARGDAKEDSDYDFLVVMDSRLSSGKRVMEVRKAGRVQGYPMDFIVRTPEEMEHGFILKKSILLEGKLLFERKRTEMA